jgi:hypothetical protein
VPHIQRRKLEKQLLAEAAAKMGWDAEKQVEVMLKYIGGLRQGYNRNGFEDFLDYEMDEVYQAQTTWYAEWDKRLECLTSIGYGEGECPLLTPARLRR